ncbi:helix-turn-helix domain-containing protein [Streptomyces tricolor]|nr:helix-turn-helix domain-containing protein [Streptomyces tricolor]
MREFAGRLGISPRTVSNWQRNKTSICRPQMAQILDTALRQCTPAEQEAFSLQSGSAAWSVSSPQRGVGSTSGTVHGRIPQVLAGVPR